MTNKLYADGKGTGYSYTNSGKLASRAWARGVTTTYTYNSAGDLHKIIYSDSTPSVTNTYDNRGRVKTVQFGTNTASLNYNDANQLVSESLNGLVVTNHYDFLFRRVTNGVRSGSTWLARSGYTHDNASRLQIVSDGTNSATYAYVPDSSLIDTITFKENTTTRMTTTKTWDKLNRLTKIESVAGGSNVSSHGYAYNLANQRTSVTNAENARWIYQYDKLGQVTSGKRYWQDSTPVSGQHFEYAFDDIGNRKSAGSGGNEWGSGLRYANYTANNLNQYTSRTVPGAVDVLGAARSNATVTVNDTPTYRKGEYFRGEVAVANGLGPIWLSLTNLAVLNDGSNPDITVTNKGDMYVPKATQIFAYDADGNLTNDGRWVYVWDAENRLVVMTSSNLAVAAGNLKLEFAYDYAWRRIAKRVYNSAGQLIRNHRFGYDGWNLLAELNTTNNATIRQYVWGLDLSGTRRNAGGVSGLLAVTDSVVGTHFAAYDGSGNVSTLVKAVDSAISAAYEYSPFGEVTHASGQMAKTNPVRFSTKYTDDESDSVYYGYRYYHSSAGRWLTRDPLGDEAFLRWYMRTNSRAQRRFHDVEASKTVYTFVANNPIDKVDNTGLDILLCTRTTENGFPTYGIGRHAYLWDDREAASDPRSCGQESVYGYGDSSNPRDQGPPYMSDVDVECRTVPGSSGREDEIMDCCRRNVNRQAWWPGHDCHDACERILDQLRLPTPPHRRWNPEDRDIWNDARKEGWRLQMQVDFLPP